MLSPEFLNVEGGDEKRETMKELCRKCGKELFKKNLLDDNGHVAIDPNSKVGLESEGDRKFFRCPHCGAKNITIASTSKDGASGMFISHWEE